MIPYILVMCPDQHEPHALYKLLLTSTILELRLGNSSLDSLIETGVLYLQYVELTLHTRAPFRRQITR